MDFHTLLLGSHLSFKKHLLTCLKEYNLKSGQPKVLEYIATHEGCQQKDIAENCYVETATLSIVLTNLEKRKLIKRKSLSKDKRAYSIYLAKNGRDVYKKVSDMMKYTEDVALEGFTVEEREELFQLLSRVRDNIREANRKNASAEDDMDISV